MTVPLPFVTEEADTDQETDRLLGQQRTVTGDNTDVDKVSSERVLGVNCDRDWSQVCLVWSANYVHSEHSVSGTVLWSG